MSGADFIDGFARHMRDALPNASYIGLTGTPGEETFHRQAARTALAWEGQISVQRHV
jgi:hypothetical protein